MENKAFSEKAINELDKNSTRSDPLFHNVLAQYLIQVERLAIIEAPNGEPFWCHRNLQDEWHIAFGMLPDLGVSNA
jgi:hypothetical protein